jgi:hypothetical protein
VSLARNVLAAAIVGAYWLFVLLWGDFLARIFNFTLSQNWPTYTALSLAALLGTMVICRRQDGTDPGRGGRLLAPAAIVLLAVAILTAWRCVARSHDRPLRQDPFALQLASQHINASPRAPGFWLPDQHGKLWRTSSLEGKVAVIAFWSPHVPASVEVLDVLRDVRDDAGADDIACVAVCLADDHAISSHVAREGRYRFPMVTDTGTHFDPKLKECAPLSEAYDVSDVPAVFVTDRGRRIVGRLAGGRGLDSAVAAAVERARAVPVPPRIGVDRT